MDYLIKLPVDKKRDVLTVGEDCHVVDAGFTMRYGAEDYITKTTDPYDALEDLYAAIIERNPELDFELIYTA